MGPVGSLTEPLAAGHTHGRGLAPVAPALDRPGVAVPPAPVDPPVLAAGVADVLDPLTLVARWATAVLALDAPGQSAPVAVHQAVRDGASRRDVDGQALAHRPPRPRHPPDLLPSPAPSGPPPTPGTSGVGEAREPRRKTFISTTSKRLSSPRRQTRHRRPAPPPGSSAKLSREALLHPLFPPPLPPARLVCAKYGVLPPLLAS